MSNNKFNWQVRAAALSVFFLGFLGGALALNAYQVWYGAGSSGTRSQRFERIFDQLELSDAQKMDVQKIVGETRGEIQTLKKDCDAHVQEIRAHSDERFKGIFSDEQYGKFVNLRDELRQSRKSGNGN
jgi:hypothetical protein